MNPLYAAVAERALHRCEYCSAPEVVFNFPFEVEHILPPTQGGKNESENNALACRSCNLFKSDSIDGQDSQTGQRTRLFHPRCDVWSEHFRFNADLVIEPLTAIGRATCSQLRMNSSSQVAARTRWQELGLMPSNQTT